MPPASHMSDRRRHVLTPGRSSPPCDGQTRPPERRIAHCRRTPPPVLPRGGVAQPKDFQAVTPLESNFLHQRIVKTPLEAYSGDLGGSEHCLEETSTFYRIPPGVTWRDLRRSAPCPPKPWRRGLPTRPGVLSASFSARPSSLGCGGG